MFTKALKIIYIILILIVIFIFIKLAYLGFSRSPELIINYSIRSVQEGVIGEFIKKECPDSPDNKKELDDLLHKHYSNFYDGEKVALRPIKFSFFELFLEYIFRSSEMSYGRINYYYVYYKTNNSNMMVYTFNVPVEISSNNRNIMLSYVRNANSKDYERKYGELVTENELYEMLKEFTTAVGAVGVQRPREPGNQEK